MKHIIASLLFLITTPVLADPAPFGLEIGKATLADAEKMYSIDQSGPTKYGNGSVYKVVVDQVDFEGLKELTFSFNEKGVLTEVVATLPKSQFKSLHHSLAKKYKVVGQEIPYVGDSVVEYLNGSTRIFLNAPHLSFDMHLIYIQKDLLSDINAHEDAKEAAKKKSQEDKL